MTAFDPSVDLAGLSVDEAEARLRTYGPNVLRQPRRRSLAVVTAATLREPMFLLLLAAAGLYLLFGGLGEGLFLLAGALVSIGLVIFQEARSERALAALNALAEPFVRVIRGDVQRQVAARDIVPGDLVVVAEGARVPADAELVAGDALHVDESVLTGESATVVHASAGPASRSLFAGTMVVSGQGLARATETGARTRFGRIGTALEEIAQEPTLLQRNVGRLIRRMGVLAILFCLLVLVLHGWLRGDWLAGALAGITLAVALLPEEFPMVLAVFMALGAWRLARRQVLVRRSAVIETLGATTVLCVDKTGTLTENRMSLASVWRDGRSGDPARPTAEEAELLACARLASAVHPHDPMDLAIHAATATPAGMPLRSFPLRPERLAFVQAWRIGEEVVYAAKGAPETVLGLSGMSGPDAARVDGAARALARAGMRLLGVAEARFAADPGIGPDGMRFVFVGLLGFVDPVRAEVPAALAAAERAGVRVIMVTGDYPDTALAVARAAGLPESGGRVFARVSPEDKLALVERLKAEGEVVAMTGDGVNDAPALAAANVGIAMGRRGTDVAREAADLILLDDRFSSIIGGIRLGRRIFANLRRTMVYISAIHIPIAGLALLPILMGLPPILYPMHVVLLELLLDPLCSLAFEGEPEAPGDMARPPRPAGELIFGARELIFAGIQGALLLAAVFALFVLGLDAGLPEAEARGLAFIALILGNLGLALADAGGASARLLGLGRTVFWIIAFGGLAVVALCFSLPPLAAILRVDAPPIALLGFPLALAALIALVARWIWRLALRNIPYGSAVPGGAASMHERVADHAGTAGPERG